MSKVGLCYLDVEPGTILARLDITIKTNRFYYMVTLDGNYTKCLVRLDTSRIVNSDLWKRVPFEIVSVLITVTDPLYVPKIEKDFNV